MTQSEFAKEIGITQNHLSNIEQGRRNVTLEIVISLYEVFGIYPNDLLGIESNDKSSRKEIITELQNDLSSFQRKLAQMNENN